jgi:hypothetical protein
VRLSNWYIRNGVDSLHTEEWSFTYRGKVLYIQRNGSLHTEEWFFTYERMSLRDKAGSYFMRSSRLTVSLTCHFIDFPKAQNT